MSPTVSAVVPVYNGERYLREALDSVAAQTRPALEVVVVDDGSDDGSAAVAGAFAEAAPVPVRVLRQANAGATAARNHGAREATGDLLAFLDADDLWTPTALAQSTAAMAPGVDMVFGHVEQFRSPDLPPEVAARLSCPEGAVPGHIPSSTLVRRAAFWRTGGYEGRWKTGEVVDWYLRAREAGLVGVVHRGVVARRRLHEANRGVLERADRGEYARILKAALDRRRAGRAL